MYFTINVRLLTHSVDVNTENVTTSVPFLSTSPLCPLTARVAMGYIACSFWQKFDGSVSSTGHEPVQETVQLCGRRIYSCGP